MKSIKLCVAKQTRFATQAYLIHNHDLIDLITQKFVLNKIDGNHVLIQMNNYVVHCFIKIQEIIFSFVNCTV